MIHKAIMIIAAVLMSFQAKAKTATEILPVLLKCSAISSISTFIHVPFETLIAIKEFDADLVKVLKQDDKNTKRASNAYSERAASFMDLYVNFHPNGKSLLNKDIRKIRSQETLNYVKLVKENDDWLSVMATDLARCQAIYMSVVSQAKKVKG